MEKYPDYTTTYKSIAGWKAVLLTWNEEEGFYEPFNTGYFGYKKEKEAEIEAKCWAEAEEIEYKPRVGGV